MHAGTADEKDMAGDVKYTVKLHTSGKGDAQVSLSEVDEDHERKEEGDAVYKTKKQQEALFHKFFARLIQDGMTPNQAAATGLKLAHEAIAQAAKETKDDAKPKDDVNTVVLTRREIKLALDDGSWGDEEVPAQDLNGIQRP